MRWQHRGNSQDIRAFISWVTSQEVNFASRPPTLLHRITRRGIIGSTRQFMPTEHVNSVPRRQLMYGCDYVRDGQLYYRKSPDQDLQSQLRCMQDPNVGEEPMCMLVVAVKGTTIYTKMSLFIARPIHPLEAITVDYEGPYRHTTGTYIIPRRQLLDWKLNSRLQLKIFMTIYAQRKERMEETTVIIRNMCCSCYLRQTQIKGIPLVIMIPISATPHFTTIIINHIRISHYYVCRYSC